MPSPTNITEEDNFNKAAVFYSIEINNEIMFSRQPEGALGMFGEPKQSLEARRSSLVAALRPAEDAVRPGEGTVRSPDRAWGRDRTCAGNS